MVKFVEETAQTQAPAKEAPRSHVQETQHQPFASQVESFNTAFDWDSTSSTAKDFVKLLKEAAEKNEYLARFRYGTVKGISADMGSAAYVAGQLNGAWLYGLVFFEKGQSIRIFETQNRQEDYYTLTSLVKRDVLDKVEQSMREEHGLDNVHYMLTNNVPDFADQVLDAKWSKALMGQMLLGIFGRAVGALDTINLKKSDRFTVNVAAPESGNAPDANGHPNRADIALYVTHTPSNVESSDPTLLSDSLPTAYPDVRSCGYTNIRFTGLRETKDGIVDLKQLQGEVVVSLIDSQERGAKAPLERQLIAFAGFAEIAQNGGWRDLYINTLNKRDRKFSALATYLNWGTDTPDLSKIDGSRDQIDRALRLFADAPAALVVHHRAGNGVGGLSNLFAEIALRNTESLGQLLAICDSLFQDSNESFTSYLGAKLNTTSIRPEHVVSAAVPNIDGAYTDTAMRRSLQDMDLTSVASYLGDKQEDMLRYFFAQSYSNRELEGKAQRIYLAKLAASMFGGRNLKLTGESLDMAINPVFAAAVLEKVRQKCNFQVNGVNANNDVNNTLFYNRGGETFTLSGAAQSGGVTGYAMGVTLPDYKL